MSNKINDTIQETRREFIEEMLYEPTEALTKLQDFRDNLQDKRYFTFKDGDSDIVETFIQTLNHTIKVSEEIKNIIREQSGIKFSDKYHE